ncbi:MAG: hypothetical protein P4L46_17075 [Fimbriimonas sp.]|nr:hypothetical protein [Fimbriimonas sp.]
MNLNEFENHLNGELTPLEPTVELSGKIDRAIRAATGGQRRRLRMRIATVSTALIAVGLFALPTIRTHAELQRMVGAMDNVQSVIMRRQTVLPDGTRKDAGTISYLNGRWRVEEPFGALTYFLNGTRYRLDKPTGRFIEEIGLAGPFRNNTSSLTLSSALGDLQKWDPSVHVEVDRTTWNGREVSRATISEPSPLNRTVLYADADTDLPIEIDTEMLRSGRWLPEEIQTFDYRTKQDVTTFVPDLKSFPPISKGDWEAAMVQRYVMHDLGEIPLKNGRLVVRAIDVAKDGTVFVACQAGDRVAQWDRGYPVDLSDGRGTKYALVDFLSRTDKEFIDHSKDGKLEVCVFVPTEPTTDWSPRELTVTARLTASRSLARHLVSYAGNRKGDITSTLWYFDDTKPIKVVTVAQKAVKSPTVQSVPDYAVRIEPSIFGDPFRWEIKKAKARADYYRSTQDETMERSWLSKTIGLSASGLNSLNADKRLEELNQPRRVPN